MVVYGGGGGGGGGQWLGGGWLLTEFVYGDPPLSCTFAFPFY